MRVCDCCEWPLRDRRVLIIAEKDSDGELLECDGIRLPELCAECEVLLEAHLAEWVKRECRELK